jgi:ankyrin repeat protein
VALIELIQQGQPEAAFALLEQNPSLSDEVGADGISAAMIALYYGQRDLAEQIISQKSEITVHEAAAFGRIVHLEKLLTDGNKESFSPDGFQPLHLAAYFGRQEALKVLLGSRVSLDTVSENGLGVSPLHSALANDHETVARELVYEGADVNLATKSGWTPLHYAANLGNRPLALFLKEHGAEPKPGPEGKFPRDIAVEKGHQELAEVL